MTAGSLGLETAAEGFEDRLAASLQAEGRLSAEEIERARRGGRIAEERLHVVLSKLGLLTEAEVARSLATLLELPLVGPEDFPAIPPTLERLPPAFLRERRVLPLAEDGESVTLALADPLDRMTLQAVALRSGRRVVPCVALPEALEAALERFYGDTAEPAAAPGEAERDGADEDLERLRATARDQPVVQFVDQMIAGAVAARASDIHLEPFEGRLRLRWRIDGELREMPGPPSALARRVVNLVKIKAGLDIAEHRLPQDGRIREVIRGRSYDFRVATIPTLYGEAVVLRVLDRQGVTLDFGALGFDDTSLPPFLAALERPHGILLVTGPTGSGKTTTLYTSLLRLNAPDRKILTVEDPIEYQLEGVNQIQVKPEIDLTFATLLRSILRHDPDVIMVGEIRDLETAEIAVQAALTGHLVLSTLHTNDSPSTIGRLLDMGVRDYLVTSTLNGVQAQRLVRRLCPACREPYEPSPEVRERTRLEAFAPPGAVIHRAVGCTACGGSGYRGRLALVEVMPMSEPLRRLVLRQADAGSIGRAAREEGMRSLYEDGLAKVLAGLTSIDEVLRVARDD